MLSTYQSVLRTRVIEVAHSRLLILPAFAAACALFRLGHLPQPSAIFVTVGVWTAIAMAAFLTLRVIEGALPHTAGSSR